MTRQQPPTRFEATPDPATGRVVYRVPRVGAFTIGWHPAPADSATAEPGNLVVLYGARTDPWQGLFYADRSAWPGGTAAPELPTVNGITLGGACVYGPARRHNRDNPYWLVVRRHTPSVSHPPGPAIPIATRERVTAIVADLTADYLDRPDQDALRAVVIAHAAPIIAALHRTAANDAYARARDLINAGADHEAAARRLDALTRQETPA